MLKSTVVSHTNIPSFPYQNLPSPPASHTPSIGDRTLSLPPSLRVAGEVSVYIPLPLTSRSGRLQKRMKLPRRSLFSSNDSLENLGPRKSRSPFQLRVQSRAWEHSACTLGQEETTLQKSCPQALTTHCFTSTEASYGRRHVDHSGLC